MAFLFAIGLAAVVFYILQTRLREQAERIDRLHEEVRRLAARVAPPEAPAAVAPESPPAPLEATSAPGSAPETVAAAASVSGPLNVPEAPIPSPPPLPVPAQSPPTPFAPPVPPVEPAAPPPVRQVSLEERLGARLPVWIGSIALALAGAFLVKYSFDRGWFSPTVRVVFGVLFGVILLGAGEWMRRSSERIAQGLSAAGVADLYACFLAGIHLYGIIQPAVGFGLMALTTVVAVVLSLRQGIMVALIGMIGGFLTPYLVRTGEPDVRGIFAYLLLLQVGLLTVARRRDWPAVGALALGGGLFWAVAWVFGSFQAEDTFWLGLFVALSVLSTLIVGLAGVPRDAEARSLGSAWVAVPGGLLAMALVAGRGGYAPAEWGLFGLIAAGTLVLARLRPAFRPLAWVAAGATAVLLGAWGLELEDPEVGRFLLTAAALGVLLAGGAYAAAWRDETPGHWGALSAASGIVVFLIVLASTENKVETSWGAVVSGIAAMYLIAALPVARRRPAMDGLLAALAVAVTFFVSLAVPLELERQWLTVGWALEVAALVWLAGKFRLPPLTALARVLAIGVAVRLLLNASVLDYPLGDHPLLHWLWYGYGVPLLAFAAAAVLARRRIGEEGFATMLEAGALAFAFTLATLVVRQFFHPGRLAASTVGLAEWGTLVIVWTVLGGGLLVASRRWLAGLPSLEWGGRIGLLGGAALLILGPLGSDNPLWVSEPVGETPIWNLLLWVYGVPAVLFGLAAAELRRRESRRLAPALAILTVVLAFALVSLEVRQAFQGSVLNGPATSIVERWSYSAAWILFGAALLVLGVTRRGKMLRYASLAVMLLVIAKVFLYDMANLSDLWRVFSFLGLGVSLLALAWVYQRFVFRERG
jgi:uncharacterized membrane protein